MNQRGLLESPARFDTILRESAGALSLMGTLLRVVVVCLSLGAFTPWVYAQATDTPSTVVVVSLRPVAGDETDVPRIKESQQIRQAIEKSLAEASRLPIVGHKKLLSTVGKRYLANAFDCGRDAGCIQKLLADLRDQDAEAIWGEYRRANGKLTFSLYAVHLASGEMRALPDVSFGEAGSVEPSTWTKWLASQFAGKGTVVLVPNVEDTSCQVDGKDCSFSGENRLELTPGQHTIKLTKEGHSEASKTVTVKRGEVTRVVMSLDPAGAGGAGSAGGKPAPAGQQEGPASYAPVWAQKAPNIDGSLDDEIWKQATKQSSFFQERSKPHGLPGTQPTEFQVAFDADYLYIAMRCGYSPARNPRDAAPLREAEGPPEFVIIYVDGENNQTDAIGLAVSPYGYLSDVEMWNDGSGRNYQWDGEWDAKTKVHDDSWTVEYRIPWKTVKLRPRDGKFKIGFNIRRKVNPSPIQWALSKAGTLPQPSTFGTLDGIHGVSGGSKLSLSPYGLVALPITSSQFDRTLDVGRLRDFDGDATRLRPYFGTGGRIDPAAGFRINFVLNPDFSQVRPDAAIANLDRFELLLPDYRKFFVEASPSFAFGPAGYTLFYSRRIGLRRRLIGFDDVPILAGVNMGFRKGGLTVAGMYVFQDELDGPVEGGVNTRVERSHIFITRARQSLGPSYIGAMFLNRTQPFAFNSYHAGGVDGQLTLLKNHVFLRGFTAYSNRLELVDGLRGPAADLNPKFEHRIGLAVFGEAEFQSETLGAKVSSLNVDKDFNADLGFFRRTGIREMKGSFQYKPQLHTDEVRNAVLETSVNRMVDVDDGRPIFERFQLSAKSSLLNGSSWSVAVQNNTEWVRRRTFFVAGHKIGIEPGQYSGWLVRAGGQSPEWDRLRLGVTYTDGTFFGNHQRIVATTLQLRLNKVSVRALYEHYIFAPSVDAITQSDDQDLIHGDRLSTQFVYAHRPDLRLLMNIEANTLDESAVTQFIASYLLTRLSSAVIVFNRSGVNIDGWAQDPAQQVLLKFEYNLSLL